MYMMLHQQPIRLISRKRAATLRKKGVYVQWSSKHHSHVWLLEDLFKRKEGAS